MNQWIKLKQHINSKGIGSYVTRQELLKVAGSKKRKGNQDQVDLYRRMLTMVGILDHVGVGKYLIIKHIKDDLSSYMLKKAAYAYQPWQRWFIITSK